MTERKMIRTNVTGYGMCLIAGVMLAGAAFPPLFALAFFIPRLLRRRRLKLVEKRTASYRAYDFSVEGLGRIGDALNRR